VRVLGPRVLVFVVAGVAVAAAGARAENTASIRVIQGDHVVGGLRMGRGTVDQAIARFGAPTLKRSRPPACVMTWPALGLTISFLDFGGATPCAKGAPVAATITSRAQWRTALGLRVGDTVARLKTLFPRAVPHTGSFSAVTGFWLVPRHACGEVGGDPYPGLLARIRNGRVSALVVRAGVCE
jgi:hypothetical protein